MRNIELKPFQKTIDFPPQDLGFVESVELIKSQLDEGFKDLLTYAAMSLSTLDEKAPKKLSFQVTIKEIKE